MRTLYSIPQTNPFVQATRHIDNGEGKPLCGTKIQAHWQPTEGYPTCKKCLKAWEVKQ